MLIDGFAGLVSTLLEPSGALSMSSDLWSDLVTRLVIDGRQVGIHTVITADRRNAVPSRLHSAVANRLILRHADEGSYAEHGVPLDRARGLDLKPGRGLLHGAAVIQVASVSSDPVARSQGEALAVIASTSADDPTSELASAPLPDHLSLERPDPRAPGPAAPAGALRAVIGAVDVSGMPAVVDLDWANLAIAGPPRSGRSTALAAAATALGCHSDVTVVGPASSPLGRYGFERAAFGRAIEVAPFLDRLANELALARPRPTVRTDHRRRGHVRRSDRRPGPRPARRPRLVPRRGGRGVTVDDGLYQQCPGGSVASGAADLDAPAR